MDENEAIKKVEEYLKSINELDEHSQSKEEILREFILPGIKSSKDVLGALYNDTNKKRSGFIGKIKTKIERKIMNIVVNVVEKQSSRQQKYNDLVYKALEIIIDKEEKEKK